MRKESKKEIKKALLCVFALILVVIFFAEFVASQQTALYCAERTTDGAACQMVEQTECGNGQCQPTSCESTSYCSTGTCVNTATGECLPSPQATCNPSEGGLFYDKEKEDVVQCQTGCCLLGDSASLVERARCDEMGKDYNVKATFRADIKDSFMCAALASPKAEGACVFETSEGRACTRETRGECTDSEGEFHEGFLCTAPSLGTLCHTTKKTTCIPGKNEVYFVDSCNNIANIYDANKVDDISGYWSFLPGNEGVEVNIGDGSGNKNSPRNGFCSYLAGSTCGSPEGVRPTYGDYICRDLSCSSSPETGRIKRAHGESWCMDGNGTVKNINYFENANPGDISYLAYCYDGEVQYELCDNFRNELCTQNQTTKYAVCVANRWLECIFQTSEEDCLDTDERDCKLVYGVASAIPEENGKRTVFDVEGSKDKATCAPKYPPGFKFWDPKSTIADLPDEEISVQSFCGFSSIACRGSYSSVWGVDWTTDGNYNPPNQECFENLIDERNSKARIRTEWATNWQTFCSSIGDCGVSSNYLNQPGRNSWADMFTPGNKNNVGLEWVPNLNSKK